MASRPVESMSHSQLQSAKVTEISSSPDPLNDTLANHHNFVTSSPSRRRSYQTSKTKRDRNTSQGTTPSVVSSKQELQSQVSPSRTITEQTLSPWKIRVTVEAEPEDTELDGKVKTYTQTTTIPLRSGSSPLPISNVTTGRGRRSGSQTRTRAGSTSSNKPRQRSTTPKAGRTRRQSVTDLDIVVLGDDGDDDEWGQKPRRRSPKKSVQISNRTMGRNRIDTKSTGMPSSEFAIQTETHSSDDEQQVQEILPSKSPELREIDLNRVSVRPRANSMKHKISSISQSGQPLRSTESEDNDAILESNTSRKVSANSTRSYPTPSPTPSNSDPVANMSPDKGRNEGFDTIIESEGFTMIDLDSIPSVRQLRSSPMGQEADRNGGDLDDTNQQTSQSVTSKPSFTTTPGKPFPSYLHLAEGESDISSAIPSSPPLPTSQLKACHHQTSVDLQIPISSHQLRNRTVTPLTYSSPKLPSPPRATLPKDRPTPDSSQAVKVGLVLQDTIEPRQVPNSGSQRKERQILTTPKDQNVLRSTNATKLFEGFDSGTQRELRAGLRFGEELAKKPQPSSLLPSTGPDESNQFQIWRADPQVYQPPQPSQTPTVQGTTKTFGSVQSSSRRPSTLSQMTNLSDLSSPVEKQAKSNPSQECEHQEIQDITMEDAGSYTAAGAAVDDDDDADDADIWLAEARQSSSSPSGHDKEPEDPRPLNKMAEPVQAKNSTSESLKAHTSKLWKHSQPSSREQTELSALTCTEGDSSISGLFWKPRQEQQADIRFGAGQIKDARRELRISGEGAFSSGRGSGDFDVGKMLGTPKRIREPLKTENTQPQFYEKEVEDESEEDTSQSSEQGSLSDHPQTILVNFNDSTVSEVQHTPFKTRLSLSPSARRPPTPRSAIKGSRQSFGPKNGVESTDDSDQGERRVVWAKKSNHMNEDWIESSRSIQSDEISIVQSESVAQEADSLETDQTTSGSEQDLTPTPMPATQPELHTKKNRWFTWPSKSDGKDPDSTNELVNNVDTAPPCSLGTMDSSNGQNKRTEQPVTETSPPYSEKQTQEPVHRNSTTVSMSRKLAVPSYLTKPSYPSDPGRSTSTPLSTSGEFSNSHFRTLHIIYAKSSRPRFHAPQVEDCRPEIRKLVTDKWQLYIDEDRAGMGGFSFKFGAREGRVLERFCREIEWDYLYRKQERGETSLQDIFASPYGIWGGASHGQGSVQWGWTCEGLAERLGRIIVGEVVRAEEFGGSKH